MHTASAMLGRAAAPCASPPPRAAPKAARGSAARPLRAAARKTTPEAAENELAALKRQVEQADALINAGRLAEAEQVLGFIVPTMKPGAPGGKSKSAGQVIWGVVNMDSPPPPPLSAVFTDSASASASAPEPEVPAPPAVSEEEELEAALVLPVIALDLARPLPTAEDSAWLLLGEDALASVRGKALQARLDGTDAASAFTDANGLVGYIASLPREEQVAMEPGLRGAMEDRRRASDSAPAGSAADPEYAALLCGCGWLSAARGDYADADMLYRDALALLRRRAEAATAVPEAPGAGGLLGKLLGGGGGGSRGALPAGPAAELQLCLASLAKLAQARGALNEAEALWRDALAAADALFGGGGAEHANAAARDATRALALLAAAKGQDTQAAKLFRESAALERALADADQQPGPYRFRTA